MKDYKPAEHSDTSNVAPLVQFFELVHIGDTIQSIMQVYFDKELVGCYFFPAWFPWDHSNSKRLVGPPYRQNGFLKCRCKGEEAIRKFPRRLGCVRSERWDGSVDEPGTYYSLVCIQISLPFRP
jgi:hypothetical protein